MSTPKPRPAPGKPQGDGDGFFDFQAVVDRIQPSRRGRPTKLTPELAKTMIEARKLGLSEGKCCVLAGIDPSNLARWRTRAKGRHASKYAEFIKAFAIAVPHAELANLAIIRAARKKDWRAAVACLRFIDPDTYADRVKYTEIKDLEKMSDENLARIARGEQPVV